MVLKNYLLLEQGIGEETGGNDFWRFLLQEFVSGDGAVPGEATIQTAQSAPGFVVVNRHRAVTFRASHRGELVSVKRK